jgi:rhodanese-related sulfurtransferase
MIKQITCKEIKDYVKNNPKTVLLDVRTQGELNSVGKPDGDKIGLKTYFLEIKRDGFFDFVQEFKNLNINQDKEILVICKSGERSQISAELLSRENFKSLNISDGFEGSQEGIGWINNSLPVKF